ncbi:uncharacterized protein LOC133150348 [Syngnathus typhle]|uniref:uncharacterized protein LOC133150348 n=1 Tax=Syngnathus typhle TaxID=161592 RepID=UPI002A6A146C|nr:uncharacterized protein LOC133150348 [Syngnathus typhle]
MYACCVLGCPNRHTSGGKLKFYRLPTEYRAFQAKRRRLWLKVLQQVNGSAEELKENARICGAHFISGEPSVDQNNPDFVPSVFTNVNSSSRPRSQSRRIVRGHGKWHWGHQVNQGARDKSKEALIKDEDLVIQQPSLELIRIQPSQDAQTTQCAMTGEASTEETKSDIEMRTPSPLLKFEKSSPVVLLKHIVAPSGVYLCELCNENFSTVTQLVRHKLEHEGQRSPHSGDVQEEMPTKVLAEPDEPAFPCNICDRTFADRQLLKRHKLLHMRDVRKCQTCGVLFCQLHRRAPLVATPVITSESDDDCPVTESDDLERGEVGEQLNDFQTAWAFIPLLRNAANQISEPQASASNMELEFFSEMPPPPFPIHLLHTKSEASMEAPLYPPPKLPPALRMFSAQCLTSAFFKVQRNYNYILSKGTDVPNNIVVKKEPLEISPDVPPDLPNEEPEDQGPTAYDLQIVL